LIDIQHEDGTFTEYKDYIWQRLIN
jgi:hypothetical protein